MYLTVLQQFDLGTCLYHCTMMRQRYYTILMIGKPWKIPQSQGVILKSPVRAVCKHQGLGIFPGYYEHDPWLLLYETKGKLNQKNFLAVQFPAY